MLRYIVRMLHGKRNGNNECDVLTSSAASSTAVDDDGVSMRLVHLASGYGILSILYHHHIQNQTNYEWYMKTLPI